jgi:hypothetical protein
MDHDHKGPAHSDGRSDQDLFRDQWLEKQQLKKEGTEMKGKYLTLLASVGFAALLFTASTANAQPALGWADTFAVLGGSAVTLTNATVVGDVGSPVAVTNTASVVTGTVYPAGDPVAVAAYGDFLSAYTALGNEPCGTVLAGDLTGLSLTPGVYCVTAASTTTTGTLTLVGNPTDTWIFKIGTGGTGALTGTNFSVVMSSGETCNKPVDMFSLRERYSLLSPLLDAEYGSATFIPAKEPTEVEVRVSTTGLLVRKADPQ